MARLMIIGMVGALLAAGCGGKSSSTATTRPTMATDVPAQQARPQYWYNQPDSVTVTHADYDRLYEACEHALRQRRFVVDREDYRSGLLTTRPLISQQFWEFWRDDVGDGEQLMASSLATYRRTVRWTIAEQAGGYVASPKVVVERFSGDSRRITSAVYYTSVLNAAEAQTRLGSTQLAQVPTSRWYATGRDEPLEADLAKDVQSRLKDD